MLEKYQQWYSEKLNEELNEKEKEYYELLNQISIKPTEENLNQLHHQWFVTSTI